MTPEQLRSLAQAMGDDSRVRLAEMRGGCCCHLSPPCSACCEPLTEEEAESLGLLDDAPVASKARRLAPTLPMPAWDARTVNPDHAMAAVRAMCKGMQ